ncbi:hypothetical protein [Streptomyces lavendulae]|uniref:hypothetical protein n=1 Tax=Streptomyces lavendulae TaxID=1914 RepID=UPI0024A0065F|nr:hypothetical protein [Streptomyces lavendulae]GLX24174.1 hypothetical protein Slala01_78180 [Streptomyces lavendulae subsp. lavendulae]
MKRWTRWASVAAVGVPVALTVVACAGEKSLEDAAKGTWDCTIARGARGISGTVTVGDGTYQVSQGGGRGSSGTWQISGGKLEVKGDDGPYHVSGVPGEVKDLMGMEFGEGSGKKLSPWSVGWKGNTVTFPYHGAKVTCQKM